MTGHLEHDDDGLLHDDCSCHLCICEARRITAELCSWIEAQDLPLPALFDLARQVRPWQL